MVDILIATALDLVNTKHFKNWFTSFCYCTSKTWNLLYVSRRWEPRKKYRRRSTFGVGKDGEQWINYLDRYSEYVQELMKLTRNKRRFYQQGIRAATQIGSIS